MSGFWDKKGVKTQEAAYQEAESAQPDIVLDEEALQILQEDPNVDIFEEEEDDTAELMFDANLRLEQGRLYQMILRHDLFGETDADPKAIRNVQREIRKFVRERMETMLGIRQEQVALEAIISSPFNDMEVTVLKMLASKMSKGATEEAQAPIVQAPAAPKKDGITSISGTLRANPTPIAKKFEDRGKMAKPVDRNNPAAPKKKVVAKSAILTDDDILASTLAKPIDEMTPEELAAHDAAALERRSKNYATRPTNLVPHPTGPALEALYTQQASAMSQPGSAISNMMHLMNQRK